ncbi:tetratricopeptide repeat protein [Luminiphilus sp.]|nr:tetratricopeptide repeat protein [Luminiphilus sp.]MDA9625216.1 tetratricopeptide repeat protein [Luminiphilus sp.]
MELTVDQALQQGVAAHKVGKLQDAERLYRAILQTHPKHPDANHNLGVLALAVGKPLAALPLLKLALEVNPKIEQFWLSYADALIKLERFDEANRVLVEGEKSGAALEQLDALKQRPKESEPKDTTKTAKGQTLSEKGINLAEKKSKQRKAQGSLSNAAPSRDQLNHLQGHYQAGRLEEAEALATLLTRQFPKHPFGWKVLGAVLRQTGRLVESLIPMQSAVKLSPQDAEAHSNLGVALQEQGRLDEAEASYRQAIALKPDYAEANYNLGNTLKELGRLDEAEANYRQAIALKPGYTVAYWNLHGNQKTIQRAEHCIDKCLEADESYVKARLMKAALRFYQGDKSYFNNFMQSELKQHAFMRSFAWVFSLPNLPELHFNKFYFFDAIIKKSIIARPFYEFGVWRASSFNYLINVFKKGYGFDTFTGLPEDWNVGGRLEKAGTYTSDGNVPKIKGGEFIVGKFEDTLPVFFSEHRPTASVINFDADLYSSTICALNFSKAVMDKDTILIFDEFIINESWEQDEFRALNEFCSINHHSYEVIAVSFFSKQVAVKLIGI